MDHSIFGCKVNKFYLNKWLEYFSARGTDLRNAHLMATCVVTDRAKAKWIKQARKILKSGQALYLTGCGAFEKGEAMDYAQFFELYPSLQMWKEQITLLGEDPAMQTDLAGVGTYELNTDSPDGAHKKRLYTKKFIVIQSGCDTYCTFCLTIYRRGSNRNRAAEEILEEINEFVSKGGKEIVITGVNLAARGASHTRKSGESEFSSLLQMILKRTSIERIRISSLGPEFLDDAFFALMEDRRFLPHFHFSIQHFDDYVLTRMNRNYDSAVLDSVLSRIRTLQRHDRDYISIGADLIVGFPGESEEAFQTMLNAVKQYRITKLHAFPFSPHERGETVPAGAFKDQVDGTIKKQRMQKLLAVGEQVREEFVAANKGQAWRVLVEQQKHGVHGGRTDNYIQVDGLRGVKRGDIVTHVL